jgi:hypothetical protein
VECLLASLNVVPKLPHSIDQFLKQIKKKGSTDLNFKFSKEFKEHFKLHTDSITFKTHKELDSFVSTLEPKSLEAKFFSERAFLKSMDRAFWMKYYFIEGEIQKLNLNDCVSEVEKRTILDEVESLRNENKEFQSMLDQKNFCCCPFDDPIVTNSIIL